MTAITSPSTNSTDATPRLAPGHLLYAGPGDQWRYATPDGAFLKISGDSRRLDTAIRRLRGQDVHGDEDAYQSLVALLADQGALATEETERVPAASSRLLVTGSGIVARTVAEALGQELVSDALLDEDAIAEADVLVSCSGWLPDERWRVVDACCLAHGTAWVRSHVEGNLISVGPVLAGADTPSYADYRGRRRAASPAVDELDALWRHLGAIAGEPVELPIGPATIAAGVVLGRVHDLLMGRGRAAASAAPATEITVRLTDGHLETHTVLPLPDGIA